MLDAGADASLQRRCKRIVGPAFTLRFVPAREDLATPESWSSPRSTRAAIEDMPEGCIAVVDAMGVQDAGIFGDILTRPHEEARRRGAVTDGVMRDGGWRRWHGLPVWCAGVAAPASVAGLTFVGWQEPIGCGGVAVFPNDVIVADGDGAVVIPAALVDEVAKAAVGAGAARDVDHARGREGRSPARPLPAECRDEGALRGRVERSPLKSASSHEPHTTYLLK